MPYKKSVIAGASGHVESYAFDTGKLNTFNIIDKRISILCNNSDLPPKLKLTFRHLKKDAQEFDKKLVFAFQIRLFTMSWIIEGFTTSKA